MIKLLLNSYYNRDYKTNKHQSVQWSSLDSHCLPIFVSDENSWIKGIKFLSIVVSHRLYQACSLLRYFFKNKNSCTLVILTIWFGCLKFELNIIINIITTIIDFVFCHFWRKGILFLVIFQWKAGFFEHHKRQEENSSFDRRKSVWISRRKTIYILLDTQSCHLHYTLISSAKHY